MHQTQEIPNVAVTLLGLLHCPNCGERGYGYLHQESVQIGWRDKEDGPATIYNSSPQSLMVVRMEGEDISYGHRRDWLTIYFSCEGCSRKNIALVIYQRKGQTFMAWAYKGDPVPEDMEEWDGSE